MEQASLELHVLPVMSGSSGRASFNGILLSMIGEILVVGIDDCAVEGFQNQHFFEYKPLSGPKKHHTNEDGCIFVECEKYFYLELE